MRFTTTLALTSVLGLLSSTVTSTQVSSSQNDLNVLEYALTAEQFEAAFYAYGLKQFNQSAFEQAGYNSTVYENLQLIAQEEQIHANTLNSSITMLGGQPVMPCQYNFSVVNSVSSFLQYASIFEMVGVNAYDGAIDAITSTSYQQVAAQIAVIEGKHASYINYIQGILPFPYVFDNATSPNNTWPLLAPFIGTCSGKATAEWPLPNGVPGIALPVKRTMTSGYQLPSNATESELITLQYALTYELLEETFYTTNFAKFNETDFMNAGYNATDYLWVQQIVRNEQTHVITLQTLAEFLGANDTQPPCSYKFPNVTNVHDFLLIAGTLCDVGASAYVGAAPTIYHPALQQAAAAIATVEGRQSAYLEAITSRNPVYYTFQKAYNASTIIDFAAPYLNGCPYPLKAPNGIIAKDTIMLAPNQTMNQNTPNTSLRRLLKFAH